MASTHTLPALDEATFQQMLEAAYVLQERSQQPRPAVRRKPELVNTLAEIAATQEVLHSKEWDLNTSANLIAEQLLKITSAQGAAVALIREDELQYSAAVGTVASLGGMSIPVEPALAEFLQTAAADPALISGLLKRHDTRAPFWFPIYHEGKAAGLLDVRFGECDGIPEAEVQSCQVMAGLMGQAIVSAAKREWKSALAAERATMLDVLERLRPQLERLATDSAEPMPAEVDLGLEKHTEPREKTAPEIEALLTAMSQAAEKTGNVAACRQCGYEFGERELFCGRCGTPRLMSTKPEELDFSHPAPPEPMRVEEPVPAAGLEPVEEPEPPAPPQWLKEVPLPQAEEPAVEPRFAHRTPDEPAQLTLTADDSIEKSLESNPEEPAKELIPESVQPGPTVSAAPTWSSAAGALRWLKSLEKPNSPGRIWLAKHRGDVSIALSALVLLIALTGWGLHPGASHRPRLTLFERMLVGLGVAEAPPQPMATGNPNVWVWVDVHTALYYCPGSDLYGKTAGGKFALQRDAQIDQFQPAQRASCQ